MASAEEKWKDESRDRQVMASNANQAGLCDVLCVYPRVYRLVFCRTSFAPLDAAMCKGSSFSEGSLRYKFKFYFG
jgi:hypothetical protein